MPVCGEGWPERRPMRFGGLWRLRVYPEANLRCDPQRGAPGPALPARRHFKINRLGLPLPHDVYTAVSALWQLLPGAEDVNYCDCPNARALALRLPYRGGVTPS
jgi:hypothetical protein